jgi:alpha-L-fucosidase 2
MEYVSVPAAFSQDMKLWYEKPAEYFINALPVGNGRLAAMVYGRPQVELIHINEETLWSGGPVRPNPNPGANTFLAPLREALTRDDYSAADQYSRKMQGLFSQSYAPLGDLLLHQKLDGEVKNFCRDLNLETAVSTTRFSCNGVDYSREIFVSFPDQLIIVHLTSSRKTALNIRLGTQSLLPVTAKPEGDEWVMSGHAPSHADPSYMSTSDRPVWYGDTCKGMRFQLRIRCIQQDGQLSLSSAGMEITGAGEITLALSAATSFNGFNKCPVMEGLDEVALAKGYMEKATGKSYQSILNDHLKDYKGYFNRLKFSLSRDQYLEKLNTEERLKQYSITKKDQQLEVMLYQYGRYLLISSSRPGGIAANLQGKWNMDLQPAWSCNYTTNINLEMNYWAAAKTGLGDMMEPLVHQIQNMSVTGRDVASNFFNCRGWAAGHNSDIWALTNPVGNVGMGDPQWAQWVMAGPWLCQHLWDKFEYDRDTVYLRDVAYPVMKEAARFCLDWLIDDGKGNLVTAPSTSPENRFVGEDGKNWAVSRGATSDLALIRNLFKNTIEACRLLNIDTAYAHEILGSYNMIHPYQVGKKGNLQEWIKDYDESEPQHRHMSHLICLHPGNDISANTTPELFNSCKRTLQLRGDGGTGWSRAWKVCFWARLLDGNHAYTLLQNDLTYTTERGYSEAGGTYGNLFNACPPFQIDGNFGVVEGISEMLMQSHLGEIHLLPALPDAWSEGSIQGLLARGGYTISISWEKGNLTRAIIKANYNGTCILRTNQPVKINGQIFQNKNQVSVAGNTYINRFPVQAGENYLVTGDAQK